MLSLILIAQIAAATPTRPAPTPSPAAVARGPQSLADIAKGRKVDKTALQTGFKEAPPPPSGTRPPGSTAPGSTPGATPAANQNEKAGALAKAADSVAYWLKAARRASWNQYIEADYQAAKAEYEAARRACASDPGCDSGLAGFRLADQLDEADEAFFRQQVTETLKASGTYSETNLEKMMETWRASRKK
ncbi:MAG: hypothetical protein L6R30_20145 [Thermoanaerobaculia bacterium]|nr:hypothetical protein [Thermoanaerobaculia bacterium]